MTILISKHLFMDFFILSFFFLALLFQGGMYDLNASQSVLFEDKKKKHRTNTQAHK